MAGLGAFVYGTALFIYSVGHIADHAFPVHHQIGLFLVDIDLFLIGATLLISAVGFYELFIREIHLDGSTRLPTWLQMRDLNDLKARVIAMIVLVVCIAGVLLILASAGGILIGERRLEQRLPLLGSQRAGGVSAQQFLNVVPVHRGLGSQSPPINSIRFLRHRWSQV